MLHFRRKCKLPNWLPCKHLMRSRTRTHQCLPTEVHLHSTALERAGGASDRSRPANQHWLHSGAGVRLRSFIYCDRLIDYLHTQIIASAGCHATSKDVLKSSPVTGDTCHDRGHQYQPEQNMLRHADSVIEVTVWLTSCFLWSSSSLSRPVNLVSCAEVAFQTLAGT